MPTKSIPLWILVVAEALLVFTLGILGNKLATLIDISSGALYFFTLTGFVSLAVIIYLRFGQPTGLTVPLIRQLKQIKERIPVLQTDPLDKYKTEAEKHSERSVNISIVIGLAGGFLSVMCLSLPLSEDGQLILSAAMSLAVAAVLTAYSIQSLAAEDRLKGNQPDAIKLWEVIAIYFLNICFLLPGWFCGLLLLAFLKWLFSLFR